MKKFRILHFILCLIFIAPAMAGKFELELFDSTRNRPIPVMIWLKSPPVKGNHIPLVIINHGYTVKNSEYSGIAKHLADKGFFVASIQHDLPSDPLIKNNGNIYRDRMPSWEKGVSNILFVKKNLMERYPFIDPDKTVLIGHSNGGDMIMLFAKKYPENISALISLDSLRMPFPRHAKAPVLSLRAKDTKPDNEVFPDTSYWKKLKIKMVPLDANHVDLCDRGDTGIQSAMIKELDEFLNGIFK